MTLLFPGQGSQYIGMGGDLFEKFPEITNIANEVLDFPIEDLCKNEPLKLNQTQYTQPAIYTVSVLRYQQFIEDWYAPDIQFCVGHSLGEYAALYASGVFDFKTGLKLVKKRGELMQKVKNGTMAAITGADIQTIEKTIKKYEADVFIANHNSSEQIVISGNVNDLKALQPLFSKMDKVAFYPLPVSSAFHTPYMKEVAGDFIPFLENFKFSPPNIAVIANCSTELYTSGTIKHNLIKQIDHPVLWKKSMDKLLQYKQYHFYEIGPKNILSKLIKQVIN